MTKNIPGKNGTDAHQFIFKYMRKDTSADMSVSGIVSAQTFTYTCPVGVYATISRTNWHALATGIVGGGFLSLAELANGVTIASYDTDGVTVLKDYCDGIAITKHADLSLLAGVDQVVVDAVANQPDTWASRWTLAKAGDDVRLWPGQSIGITVRDDLTAIPHFQVMIQGIERNILSDE
ncbi:unnamed protein product [marine sediment metagenome]|uniref:Uncharacterized protein n=1 Tax=marine sediment metagenome TaxID=412755 RepID=X0UXB4_9ZZZZ